MLCIYIVCCSVTATRFEWNPEKNALLRASRGLGFEDVVAAILDGKILADIADTRVSRTGQSRLVVEIESYAVVVPYAMDGETMFLKTLFPDRKARKKFLGK